jgi:hypothetical protein
VSVSDKAAGPVRFLRGSRNYVHNTLWFALAGLALLLSNLVFAAGFYRLVIAAGIFPDHRAGERLATALLFGPVAGAWTFGNALRLAPNRSVTTYILVCLGLWLIVALAGRKEIRADIGRFWAWLARQSGTKARFWIIKFLFLAIAIGFVRIVWATAWVPPYANDPLEYMTVARLIAGKLALTGVYPPIDTAVTSGFYGPWTHPPGFVLLMSWVQLLQGDRFAAGAIKFINAYFLAAGAFVVFVHAGGALRYRGIIAAMLYATTPLLLMETFDHHVDIARIALWTGAFLAVAGWARNTSIAASILLGVLFGLGHFIHSIGMIALPIFVVLALIVGKSAVRSRLIGIAVTLASAIITVAPDLFVNFRVYGRLIGDHVGLWDFAPLAVAEHIRYARGIYTPYEILMQGLLSPFTRFSLFGIVPWLMLIFVLAAVVMWIRAKRKSARLLLRRSMRPTVFSVSALTWLGFFGITIVSALAGSELIIKNARYALTTIGLSCVLAVLAGDLLFRIARRRMKEERKPAAKSVFSKELLEKPALIRITAWAVRLRQLSVGGLLLVPDFGALFLVLGFNIFIYQQAGNGYRFANIDSLTVSASDQVKSGMANHPQFRMIARLNRKLDAGLWAPTGKVLSFRVGDIAYYGHFGYVSYLDPSLLPAFKADTPAEARQVLTKLGISYVAAPPYSIPEIYNSAIGTLLSDTSAVRIADSDEGYILYELLGSPQTPQTASIGKEFPILTLDSPMLEPSHLRIRELPDANAPLLLEIPSELTSTYHGTPDSILFNGWSDVQSAYFVGTPQITSNGEHIFSTRMSGTGFAQIALTHNGATVQVLWEGLIPAEDRLVSSHFDIAELKDRSSESQIGPEDTYGLTIRVKPGSKLRMNAIGLKRILGRESAEDVRVNLLSHLLLTGYEFSVSSYPASKLELEPSEGGYSAMNLDGRKLHVTFPDLLLKDDQLVDHLYPVGRIKGTLALGGAGLREVSMSIKCNRFNTQAAEEYSDTGIFSQRYLMVNTNRLYEFEADVPCKVKAGRMSAQLWRPLLGFEHAASPLSYRFGSNRMQYSFSDNMNSWQTRELRPLAERK